MITSELLDYIKTALASGQDPESIKDEMVNTGWLPEDVQKALDSIVPVTNKTNSVKREVIMTIAALLAAGSIGFIIYYLVQHSEVILAR